MDINKLIPDEEVELTEILVEKEAALSSDPNEVPEYRYSKVEDKLAKLANEDMDASASAMKAELFKDAVSGGGGGGGAQQDIGYAIMNVTNTCGKTVSVTHVTAFDGVIQEYRDGVMNNKKKEYYPVGLKDEVSSDPGYRIRFKLVAVSGSPTSITVTSPTIDGVNAGVEQDAITNGAYVTIWYNNAIPSGEVITVAVQ